MQKADFAILTILPEEYEAIATHFSPVPQRDSSQRHTYGISRVQTREGDECVVAIARTSSQGNDASQQTAQRMLHDLDPQMLLVVGIGGGVPDTDFTLGDVIVSSHIHNFDLNAMKGNQITFNVTGGIHPLVSEITSNLYLYRPWLADWNSADFLACPRPQLSLTEENLKSFLERGLDGRWRDRVKKSFLWHFDAYQRGARAPKYLAGPIASSNSLIRDDAILTQWLLDARGLRAVEMEVAGAYQAAQQIAQQYPVMAIRGISDIVGFRRDDAWKQYACHTAAAFAYAFVRAGIVEPRSKRTPEATSFTPPHSEQEDSPMPIQEGQDSSTIKIFTIYAEADKAHKERLETQLSPYTWNKKMELWGRERVPALAGPIQPAINAQIDASQIILLLVSPHFPASRSCMLELEQAMRSHTTRKAIIIPIYVRPTDWPDSPFDPLLQLPRNKKPVSSWSDPDQAWYDVAVDIRKVCDDLLRKAAQ